MSRVDEDEIHAAVFKLRCGFRAVANRNLDHAGHFCGFDVFGELAEDASAVFIDDLQMARLILLTLPCINAIHGCRFAEVLQPLAEVDD